jgi:uncharacterized membrane protein YeaQ/YmgE (transglycosylase-associated protein family)
MFLQFGLVVGIVARALIPGRAPGGWLMSMALGIGGSMLGGFIGRAVGLYGSNRGAGFIMSVIGAMLLIALYRGLVAPRGYR